MLSFCGNSKKIFRGGGRVGPGGPIRGWVGGGGSKVWGRWVMWGMGNVNQENEGIDKCK